VELVRLETEKETSQTPEQIFVLTAARERRLSRILVFYVVTGLIFMLLPGTFLGVWNLMSISSHRAAGTVPAGWIQAHGHAQIFGWIGTFILGIGYYSIPKLLRMKAFALRAPWASWTLWTSGVALRWTTGVYQWHWRWLLPASAALEIAAFLIFFVAVSGHRSEEAGKKPLEEWIFVVIAGSIGWFAALLINLLSALYLAWQGNSPILPHSFDQRFLTLETWGFLVPFVWGFSAKWLPIFLGLRAPRTSFLLRAVALNSIGVLAALCGWMFFSTVLLLAGIATAAYAIRLFEPGERAPKIKGVDSNFPVFIRLAYVWALVGAALAIWASVSPTMAAGIWGASRHALTVGFLAMMVFAVGERILPAFSGMRLLFSTKLMFGSLLLLALGCFLRVSSEILAYQGYLPSAWSWLPVSAVAEMTAVTLFALNLVLTFSSRCNRAPLTYREAA
jgi:hypothetical protein